MLHGSTVHAVLMGLRIAAVRLPFCAEQDMRVSLIESPGLLLNGSISAARR